MKRRIAFLAAVLFTNLGLLTACGSSPESSDAGIDLGMAQLPPTADAPVIVQLVQRQLSDWLAAIPEKREHDYGFESRSEFANASVGDPYEMFGINNDASLLALKTWQVPVLVDSRVRLFAEVRQSDAGYDLAGIGSAPLAEELDRVETKRAKGSRRKALLRSFTHLADFVVFNVDPSALKLSRERAVIPLKSARDALSSRASRVQGKDPESFDDAPLTLDEVASLLTE